MIEELKKKYRRLMWARWIFFILAIVACIVPTMVAIFSAAPAVKDKVSAAQVSTLGLCIGALIALGTARGAIKELSPKLPFAIGVFAVELIVLGLLCGVRSLLDDAILILQVSACGSAVGIVFGLVSHFCNTAAVETKHEYELKVMGGHKDAV